MKTRPLWLFICFENTTLNFVFVLKTRPPTLYLFWKYDPKTFCPPLKIPNGVFRSTGSKQEAVGQFAEGKVTRNAGSFRPIQGVGAFCCSSPTSLSIFLVIFFVRRTCPWARKWPVLLFLLRGLFIITNYTSDTVPTQIVLKEFYCNQYLKI